MDSNCKSLLWETTTVPAVPQPLPKFVVFMISLNNNSQANNHIDYYYKEKKHSFHILFEMLSLR